MDSAQLFEAFMLEAFFNFKVQKNDFRPGQDVPGHHPASRVQGHQFLPVRGHTQLRLFTEVCYLIVRPESTH